MGPTTQDWVAHHAAHRPDSVAPGCAEDGRTVSWRQLDDRGGRLAAVMAEFGVEHGSQVALVAENDPRVFETQFTAVHLGALFVPLNGRLTVHEMAELCADARPALLVHGAAWSDAAAALASEAGITRRVAWDDPGVSGVPTGEGGSYEDALAEARPLEHHPVLTHDQVTHVLYTSGTTGRPKGALSTWSTLVWQAVNLAATTGVALPGWPDRPADGPASPTAASSPTARTLPTARSARSGFAARASPSATGRGSGTTTSPTTGSARMTTGPARMTPRAGTRGSTTPSGATRRGTSPAGRTSTRPRWRTCSPPTLTSRTSR